MTYNAKLMDFGRGSNANDIEDTQMIHNRFLFDPPAIRWKLQLLRPRAPWVDYIPSGFLLIVTAFA